MKKYFLHINGRTVGPYSWHELKAMNLAPSTPVWFEGMANWQEANTVGELQSLFTATTNPFSQQPNPYVPPTTRSTSFSQINYSGMNPVEKKSSKIGWVIGFIVLGLIVAGIAFGYSVYEKKRKFTMEMDRMMDSLNAVESIMNSKEASTDTMGTVSSEVAVEEAVAPSRMPSDYTGRFTNYGGASIRILGGGSELQIRFKLTPGDGNTCSKEVSGTGELTGTDEITMTTTEGCKIKLKFTGTDLISIDENSDCDSFHGSKCSFVSVYLRE